MLAKSTNSGFCALCGQRATKTKMMAHVEACAAAHDEIGQPQPLVVLRFGAVGAPRYWLIIEAKADVQLGGQAFVMVKAIPAHPQPTSTRSLIFVKSYLSNNARADCTALTFILRRNASTTSSGELEKSTFVCGTPVLIDSAVLSL